MAAKEWFRSRTWSSQDSNSFFQQLRRSRPGNRAQYIRSQAHTLGEAANETGDASLRVAALQLWDMILREYPEPRELACVHMDKAEYFAAAGQLEPAAESFRASIKAKQSYPWNDPDPELHFAWHIVQTGQRNLFEEALDLLNGLAEQVKIGRFPFPIMVYRIAAARAVVLDDFGRTKEAKEWAQRALKEAARTRNDLQGHTTVGLAKNLPLKIQRRLEELARE